MDLFFESMVRSFEDEIVFETSSFVGKILALCGEIVGHSKYFSMGRSSRSATNKPKLPHISLT
jgi:hypothetical protein